MDMLVLARKLEDSIFFSDDRGLRMEVKVIEIKPNCVVLGINAPNRVQIMRGELVEPSVGLVQGNSDA
jgi:carbon storage regulator CsrA